jgi:predicted nucleotidyltransferase
MYHKSTLTALRGWAQELKSAFDPRLHEAYVFGSLVNDKGRAFSVERSDIDLILVTSESDAADRVKLLTELRPHVTDLEELLRATLERESPEPITSTTLVTEFELDQGIHKGRNSRDFFSSPGFLPLIHSSDSPAEIGDRLASDLLGLSFSIWTVMATVQARRNKFLRKTDSGNWAFDNFRSDVFVLPKDFLRAAYAVERASIGLDESFF